MGHLSPMLKTFKYFCNAVSIFGILQCVSNWALRYLFGPFRRAITLIMCEFVEYAYACGHPAGRRFKAKDCGNECRQPVIDIVKLPSNCTRCSLRGSKVKNHMDTHMASHPDLIFESDVKKDIDWIVPARQTRMPWDIRDPFRTELQPKRRKQVEEQQISPKTKQTRHSRWERAVEHLPSSWRKHLSSVDGEKRN